MPLALPLSDCSLPLVPHYYSLWVSLPIVDFVTVAMSYGCLCSICDEMTRQGSVVPPLESVGMDAMEELRALAADELCA